MPILYFSALVFELFEYQFRLLNFVIVPYCGLPSYVPGSPCGYFASPIFNVLCVVSHFPFR